MSLRTRFRITTRNAEAKKQLDDALSVFAEKHGLQIPRPIKDKAEIGTSFRLYDASQPVRGRDCLRISVKNSVVSASYGHYKGHGNDHSIDYSRSKQIVNLQDSKIEAIVSYFTTDFETDLLTAIPQIETGLRSETRPAIKSRAHEH